MKNTVEAKPKVATALSRPRKWAVYCCAAFEANVLATRLASTCGR